MASVRTIVLLFVYGLGLCVFGFLLGGAGHGIYGLLGLAGSPFSAIGLRSSWGYEAYGTPIPDTGWFVVALGAAWYLAGQALVWRMVVGGASRRVQAAVG